MTDDLWAYFAKGGGLEEGFDGEVILEEGGLHLDDQLRLCFLQIDMLLGLHLLRLWVCVWLFLKGERGVRLLQPLQRVAKDGFDVALLDGLLLHQALEDLSSCEFALAEEGEILLRRNQAVCCLPSGIYEP